MTFFFIQISLVLLPILTALFLDLKRRSMDWSWERYYDFLNRNHKTERAICIVSFFGAVASFFSVAFDAGNMGCLIVMAFAILYFSNFNRYQSFIKALSTKEGIKHTYPFFVLTLFFPGMFSLAFIFPWIYSAAFLVIPTENQTLFKQFNLKG